MKTKSVHDVMAHKSVRDVVALNNYSLKPEGGTIRVPTY